MKEMRYCTACRKTKPVTEASRWIKRKTTSRWQCEWCTAKVKRPETTCQQFSTSSSDSSQSGLPH